jgi:hypothetical protein
MTFVPTETALARQSVNEQAEQELLATLKNVPNSGIAHPRFVRPTNQQESREVRGGKKNATEKPRLKQ